MKKSFLIFIILISTYTIFPQYRTPGEYYNQSIFDLVNEKEEKIDIGLWALIIAKEYDSTIDVQKYLIQLNLIAAEIKRMLAGREKDMDKFLATKMYLYDAGKWNDNKPFSYDLKDPFGNILEHQFLSNYVDTKKGNCVSMPTLFLALMERIDPSVPFIGVKAPLHLFCRLKDRQTGDIWNVETTNGGHPARNEWYIDQMNISQTALKSGLYLKDLTKKEYLAELIGPLVHKYKTSKGKIYYHDEADKYINKAFSLGWKPESKEERQKYLNSVKAELQKLN